MYKQIKKFINVSLVLLLFIPQNILSQKKKCYELKDKNSIELYNKAMRQITYKKKEAESILISLIKKVPKFTDAQFVLANMYLKEAKAIKNDTSKAKRYKLCVTSFKQYFENIIQICPQYNSYLAYYMLGEHYFTINEYNNAKKYLEPFVNQSKRSNKENEKSKIMLENIKIYFKLVNNPVPFNPKRLKNICTDEDEYLPSLSPDGEIILYTHRYKKNKESIIEKYTEELAFSEKINSDSTIELYRFGKKLAKPFNDGRNQGGACLTIDNRHLFITICENEYYNGTSYKNCDIFTSDFENNNWTKLRRLGININKNNSFEGQPSITSDGKVLYFASVREGGFGGFDIYKSVKNNKGQWEKAQNLGAKINTKGDDKTPFIHSDSQTLYFATNGIFGMGGYDIFYSQIQQDGSWLKPINIGYPINTKNHEVGFIVSADGKKVYFSSNTIGGKSDWDIFSAELPKKVRPKKILFVKGHITDGRGKSVKNANVELTNIKTKNIIEGIVDDKTGKYAVAVTLKKNDNFLMTVKKKGHFYSTKHIVTTDSNYIPPTTINMKISPIKKNIIKKLNNVIFATNSAELRTLSKVCLNNLVEFLNDNPNVEIELRGHTDNAGTEINNMQLSTKRVGAVKKYLISKKIKASRISYSSYGELKPVTNNNSLENRAKNRRVEFVIKKINNTMKQIKNPQ